LLVGAPGHDRRTGEEQAERVRRQRRSGAAEFLEEDRRLRQRRAAAAVLARPVHRGPAARCKLALEVAPPRVLLVLPPPRLPPRVPRQPTPQPLADRELFLIERQVHFSSFPTSRTAQPTSTSSRSIVGCPARTRTHARSCTPAASTYSASSGGTGAPERLKL